MGLEASSDFFTFVMKIAEYGIAFFTFIMKIAEYGVALNSGFYESRVVLSRCRGAAQLPEEVQRRVLVVVASYHVLGWRGGEANT